MSSFKMKQPVLFIIFNRPATTQRVFQEIQKAKPPKLFVSADGPRQGVPEDAERCQAARAIINRVDWDCQVFTNFREHNLGCKLAVSSGITWFFEKNEAGIILEDDALPHPTFFRFCEEMLARYRDDKRIMTISGDNFQFGKKRTAYSYYFSRYPHIWGWATWRRTWEHYDVDMKLWPEIKKGNWLTDLLDDKKMVDIWTEIFTRVYEGKIDTWDHQLWFACLIQNGFTIIPNVNLVANIGFLPDGTHTQKTSKTANMKTEPMSFPLSHPPFFLKDTRADDITQESFFKIKSLPLRVLNKLMKIITK